MVNIPRRLLFVLLWSLAFNHWATTAPSFWPAVSQGSMTHLHIKHYLPSSTCIRHHDWFVSPWLTELREYAVSPTQRTRMAVPLTVTLNGVERFSVALQSGTYALVVIKHFQDNSFPLNIWREVRLQSEVKLSIVVFSVEMVRTVDCTLVYSALWVTI